MENEGKQTWKRVLKKERVRGGEEVLSPPLPSPAPSPFFLAHFSLRFPNYLKACYGLTTRIPSFPSFYGIHIQRERRALLALCYLSVGTDLVIPTFQLLLDCETVIFFFLVFFLLFFLCQFLSYFFGRIFSFSSRSPSLRFPPPPPPLLQTRENDHLFRYRPFVPLFAPSWLTQKVRAVLWSKRLCTDWRFIVAETLAVILNCRWQVKGLKVPFNSVWKESIVFSAKKNNNNNKNRETK